ncbi:MAG: hypothetical protein JWN04_137, partial [Myxococcaceae bacterium]|nr:hypothetical protein [Myxococcaceae bacterium]
EALCVGLTDEARRDAHLRLGEALLLAQGGERLAQLNAGLHFMHAGLYARGHELQVAAIQQIFEVGVMDGLRRDLPLIEQGFALLQAAGRDDYALASHLTLLACAAYQVDGRLSLRYGDDAMATLQRILRLSLARKLRPVLGARGALMVALLVAGVCIAVRGSRAPSLAITIRYLFFAATSLAGVAAVCVDAAAVRRYADVVLPLAALGKDHASAFIHDYLLCLAERCTDRIAGAHAWIQRILERLQSKVPIRGLPESVRHNYIAGALFSQGVASSWRDGPEALEVAERVSVLGPFHRMCADHLRAGWYAGQGNMQESGRFRQLVEKQAIALGSAWQLETWAPADVLKTAALTHDALAMKRAAQELTRLAQLHPSFASYVGSARAGYLLLRGKPREAIPWLQNYSEPVALNGWTRSRGQLASAHNALGEYAEAGALCEDALRRISAEDLMFARLNEGVELELCVAHAGLGEFALARQRLAGLLEKHGPLEGPLTLGAIHDTYVRVALIERDFAACAEHLAHMERWYRDLELPSLAVHVEALTRQVEAAEHAGEPAPKGPLSSDDGHLVTRVRLLLTQSGELSSERASKALQIAVELSGADDGFIVFKRIRDGLAAYLNAEPDPELVGWARTRLLAAYADDETAAIDDLNSLIDINLKLIAGVSYCVAPLWARVDDEDVVVAAVALGFRNTAPKLPSADVMRVIATSLVDLSKISRRPQAAPAI